ncbi:MAG: response regulator [Syntrophobacteraceae bacterium]|nr:response regulator [Syntrophobacteraceae bacterium]
MVPSRIMIVEDEAIVAMEIEERLTAMGYRLAAVTASGEEAITLAERERPDLLLMDIRLQGAMDGIQTAREIRARLQTPVIFVTAYSEDSTLERAKLAEPYGYIIKPFDDRELKSAIEIALYKHEAEKKIRRLNRLYDVLSQVNQSVVRIRTREELLPAICRLMVEKGGFGLAWIGWLHFEGSRLEPLAHFARPSHLEDGIDGFTDSMNSGVSNAMRAIRDGRTTVCNDCDRGRCAHPRQEAISSLGFRSCASFPLRFQDQIQGVLTLCSSDSNFFLDREIRLIEEVSLDISFALDTIEGDFQRRQAEDRLRTSEGRYRKLFEEATEGIVLAEAETGLILDFNRAFAEMSGYSPGELIGKPQWLLHPPEEGRSGVTMAFEEHRGGKEGVVIPCGLVTRSGELRAVEIKAHVLEIDGRRVLQGFFRDVTEELRYHRERETTLRLLKLLNHPSSAREMIRDLTRLLQEWSGCEAVGVRLRQGGDFPYFETRGFSPHFVQAEMKLCAEDALGRPILDSQGNPTLECMCGNVIAGRFNPDLPFFTRKGSFWTNSTSDLLACTSEEDRHARTRNRCHGEGYESVALIPLRYGQDTLGLLQVNDHKRNRFNLELIHFLENAADQIAIALAQRQAQVELRASEQRFRDVIEATGEYIWESDTTGRLTYASERIVDILEYRPDEVVSQRPFDFMPEEDANRLEAFFMERVQARTGFREVEQSALAKSGRIVFLSVTAVPIFSSSGALLGYRGTARDITERRQAEQERERLQARLRQAQKIEAIGTLAGGIAHDFNNILTPIIGYTEMGLSEVPESSPARYDLNQVLTAANRAKDLVKQILTFSRHNPDQIMRPTDISLVVKEALKLLRASLPSSIEMRQNLRKGMAVADASQIHQVLVNLCTNAAHAMGERGILQVSLSEVSLSEQDLLSLSLSKLAPGPHLQLSVADTGYGMDAETLEQIFDPYFTTKEMGEGTGLGLAVVHGIIEKHGGEIKVVSAPGEGSRFDVFIPSVKAEEGMKNNVHEALPGGRERILVVDDEQMIVDMAARILEQLGYRVTVRTDPREVLELLHSTPADFDLLITDFTMPHLTGLELARSLPGPRREMPVILCTGFAERVTPEEAREAGITEMVLKPYDQRRLAETVRRILDSRSW